MAADLETAPDTEEAAAQAAQRLREATKRRPAAEQSLRPHSRQSRIGNAAARHDARALSRVRHSNVWLW